MQNKRKHHQQPQFYLKGFSTNCGCPQTPAQFAEQTDSIWVYKKGQSFSENNPKCRGTSNVALARDFYAFIEKDGNKNFNKYEDLLMRNFEQPANPVIQKIRQIEKISEDEKYFLLKYIGAMVTRGKWWKIICEQIGKKTEPIAKQNVEFVCSEIERIANEQGSEIFPNGSELIELFQKLTFEGIEKEKKGEREKISMIKHAEKFCNELLSALHYRFLIAPIDMPFLTSDNPVCYTSFKNKDVQVVFPISSRVCLFATRHKLNDRKWKNNGKEFWEVDNRTLESIRDFVVRKAIEEVYFSRKSEWLVRFINNRN